MFLTRLGSGILLVALALVFILTGGPVLAAVLCLISLIAYRELGKAVGFITEDKTKHALEYTGMILTVLYYVWIYVALWYAYSDSASSDIAALLYLTYDRYKLAGGIVIAFIVYLFVYVFRFPNYHGRDVMAACFSFLYGPVMLSFLYLTRMGFSTGN